MYDSGDVSLLDESELEPPAESAVPVRIGDVVNGKFRVERLVGTGGMASVFAAHHLELDRAVALKFLHDDQAVRPDAVRRFLAEGRAAARLESVHVAKVLDVGTWENARRQIVPYLVMELLEGCDLETVLTTRGRLPVVEAVEYVFQACDAVAEAHAVGVIHRDLKPGNLFLTRKRDGAPNIKLLDFGISKSTLAPASEGASAKAMTADRELMGSPGYMSPEQVRSSKDVDARTDVWSLGVVLYELLTGDMPFASDTVADLLVEVLHSPPRPIVRLAPEVDAALEAVVVRCLQKRREDRYASIAELASALAPFRSASPLVIPELVRGHDAAPAEAGVASTIHEAPKGRHRIALSAMLGVAVVGIALGALALVKRQSSSNESISSKAIADATGVATPASPPPPSSVESPPPPAPPPETATNEPPKPPSSASVADAKSKPRPAAKPVTVPKAGIGPGVRPVPPPSPTTPQRTNW